MIHNMLKGKALVAVVQIMFAHQFGKPLAPYQRKHRTRRDQRNLLRRSAVQYAAELVLVVKCRKMRYEQVYNYFEELIVA